MRTDTLLREIDEDEEHEELDQWLQPVEESFLPEEYSFPPLPDPYEQERFLRDLEERAHSLKDFITLLREVADIGRANRRENGGTNRLYIYASRWGVVCLERTPRLKLVEGRIEVENPEYIQRGW